MERFIKYINIKMSLRSTVLLLSLLGGFSVQSLDAQVLQTYNSGANTSWTVPGGVNYIKVEAWGAGGRGGPRTTNNAAGGGGGGGAYASSILTVIPGETYYIKVGPENSTDNAGEASWFTTTNNSADGALVLAKGGFTVANNAPTGGDGGSYATSIGDIRNNGGRGANAVAAAGGGGGSSAGSTGIGINASNEFGAVGPTGNDGVGGNGQTGYGDGEVGKVPGGGGGGARRNTNTTRNGGSGAAGRVIITNLTSLAYDLSIHKTVNNTTPLIGGNVVFTVVVKNYGAQQAAGVSVLDQLPSGFTYVSHTASGYNSTTGIWTIGNLIAGGSHTLTINATVNPTGSYVNVATLTANKDNRGNSRDAITLFPKKPTANLQLIKEVDNTMPLIGDHVVFTLTAHNAGPQNATGVKIDDILSFGFTHLSNSGGYDTNTGIWNIGVLNSGSTVTLTLTATVNPTGNHYNQAKISGNEKDPNMSNNTSGVIVYPMYPVIEIVLPCGERTYNLTNLSIVTPPPGAEVSWHTEASADFSNKITGLSNVRAGQKYYVSFFDPVANCYSATSEVNIKKSCLITNPMIYQKMN